MRRFKRLVPFVIVFILLFGMVVFIQKKILPYATVLWDEGEFLLQTYLTVTPILLHDPGALATQLYRQINYPPMQYALLAPALAVIGFSVEKARLVQMIFPIITGACLFFLGQIAARSLFGEKFRYAHITGILSVFLFITSPLFLYLHTVILKESIVAAWTILTMLAYFSARKSKKPGMYTVTGILIAITFLTKYPYGILNTAIFGIETVIAFIAAKNLRARVSIVTSHVLLIVPLCLAVLGWVATSATRFNQFLYILQNNQIPTEMLGWDMPTYIFFYPKAIIYMYGITLAVGIIIFSSLVFATQYLKKLEVRMLWISLVTYILFLTPHMNNIQERYIAPVASFALVLTSIVLIDLFRRSLRSGRIVKLTIWGLLLGLTIHVVMGLPNLSTRVYAVGTKTIFAIAFNQLDVDSRWFNYDTASWGKLSPGLSRENPQDILTWIFDRIETTKPVYSRGRFTELPPPYFFLSVLMEREKTVPKSLPYKEYYVTLTVLPISRYYTYEYRLINEWVQWEVEATANNPALTLIDTKDFSELGVRVAIYGLL